MKLSPQSLTYEAKQKTPLAFAPQGEARGQTLAPPELPIGIPIAVVATGFGRGGGGPWRLRCLGGWSWLSPPGAAGATPARRSSVKARAAPLVLRRRLSPLVFFTYQEIEARTAHRRSGGGDPLWHRSGGSAVIWEGESFENPRHDSLLPFGCRRGIMAHVVLAFWPRPSASRNGEEGRVRVRASCTVSAFFFVVLAGGLGAADFA